jgi:long-chain acyl-CoA synthetase
MRHAAGIHTLRSGNLSELEFEHLDRFGVYTRLYFQDTHYTNLEELRLSGRLARVLREFHVRPGDRVVVMMPNCPELTAAFGAAWMIGAAIVPVIPQWTATEVATILVNSEASLVLTAPSRAERIAQAMAEARVTKPLLVLGESAVPGAINIVPLLETSSAVETPIDRSPFDLAILLYTSGTTGKPKGVVLTHGNLFAAIEGPVCQNPDLERGRMLHSLPLTHVYGVLIQHLANVWGWTTILLPHFEPVAAFEAIERYRIRYLPLVPTMAVYLLRHPARERFDTSCLFRITSGGAPLPEQLRLDVQRAFGCMVDQGYGLSESAAVATGYKVGEPYRAGSAGYAVPGVELCVTNDSGDVLSPGEAGEICVAGPNVTSGYWRDPDATRLALRGRWLRTGDVGYLDQDGYLFITDRKKDLIIKGGENISPREIEEVLYLHPAVAEAAVVGVPDALFGEQVCAVIQLAPGAPATADEIRAHLSRHVTRFKLPSEVVFVPALPKNNSGKILKRELKEQLAAKT